jgi:hypothetical protein
MLLWQEAIALPVETVELYLSLVEVRVMLVWVVVCVSLVVLDSLLVQCWSNQPQALLAQVVVYRCAPAHPRLDPAVPCRWAAAHRPAVTAAL